MTLAETELLKLLDLAIRTLNEMPNHRITVSIFRNSYDVIAYLEAERDRMKTNLLDD